MTVAERLAFIYGFTTMTAVTDARALSGGAYSYAQGEARVNTAGTATSLATQVSNFLVNNKPGDNDLIVITAGSRDIIANATQYFANAITADQAKANVAQAALDLATVIQQLTAAGAKHVLVLGPFSVARTPWGLSKGANYPNSSADYKFLEQLSILTSGDTSCGSFGCQLSAALVSRYPATSNGQPVLLADIAQYVNLITGTAAGGRDIYARPFPYPTGNLNTFALATASGVVLTNPDVPVCLANITLATPCTLTTIKTNANNNNAVWDYATAVFADDVNLTPAAQRMIADYIYNTVEFRAAWR